MIERIDLENIQKIHFGLKIAKKYQSEWIAAGQTGYYREDKVRFHRRLRDLRVQSAYREIGLPAPPNLSEAVTTMLI